MNMHEHIAELLPAFALGELPEPQAAEVQAHLADCADCRAALPRLRSLLTHTSRLQAAAIDSATAEAATQRLLASVQSRHLGLACFPSDRTCGLASRRVASCKPDHDVSQQPLLRRLLSHWESLLCFARYFTHSPPMPSNRRFRPCAPRLVHMTGMVNLPTYGIVNAKAEIWATPNADGTQSEDLKVVLGKQPLCYQLVIHDNKSYELLPGIKQMNVSPGKKITLNPWPGRLPLRAVLPSGRPGPEGYLRPGPRDPAAIGLPQLPCPPAADVVLAQCDLQTKMPVRMKAWFNTEFSGPPTYDMDRIVYDEPVPADLFTSQIPQDVQVARDRQMDWDANQGMSMEGLTYEEASRRIATLYIQALMRGDWAAAHNLWPLRSENDFAKELPDERPVEILDVGQPFEGVGCNAGLIVPCRVRFPQGQVYEYQVVVHSREVDGKRSCAIIAYYDWPVLQWTAEQGLPVAGRPHKEAATDIVRQYFQALMRSDWATAHKLHPSFSETDLIQNATDHPVAEILEIGQPRTGNWDTGTLFVRCKVRCGKSQDVEQTDMAVQFRQVDDGESCAITYENDVE